MQTARPCTVRPASLVLRAAPAFVASGPAGSRQLRLAVHSTYSSGGPAPPAAPPSAPSAPSAPSRPPPYGSSPGGGRGGYGGGGGRGGYSGGGGGGRYGGGGFERSGGRGGGRGRGRGRGFSNEPQVPINEFINAQEVRVLGEDKEPLGVMSKAEALALAREQECDLILIVPDASPPVVRILDYSKYKYELDKAAKENKKKQRETAIETKELKMRPGTDVHDYQVKVRAAVKFLEKGNRVKLTVQFKGREMEFKELGREMFARFVEDCAVDMEIAIEQQPMMQGRQMNMVLSKKVI